MGERERGRDGYWNNHIICYTITAISYPDRKNNNIPPGGLCKMAAKEHRLFAQQKSPFFQSKCTIVLHTSVCTLLKKKGQKVVYEVVERLVVITGQGRVGMRGLVERGCGD